MDTFFSRFIKLKSLNVLGISRNEHGETFRILTIMRSGDKISIVSVSAFYSLIEAVASADTKIPVILLLQGKGILNKEVDFNNEPDVLWYKNIEFSSIYFTSLKAKHSTFMSFCRKNIVEGYQSDLKQAGMTVIDTYVGSFLASLLQKSIKQEIILSGEFFLNFENGILGGFSKNNNNETKNYSIGKDAVSKDIMPLYGAMLHFYVQQEEVSKTTADSSIFEEFRYKKIFNFFGVVMLVGFFCALLASYILTGYYGAKNAELNLKNVYSSQSHEMIRDLEKQKESKLKILNETGFMASKFLTFYSYDILRGVPQQISLTRLSVLPVYGEIKQNRKVDLEARTVKLDGRTASEASLNSWISSLKNTEWARSFEILSIKKDKKGITHFELKILLKDV